MPARRGLVSVVVAVLAALMALASAPGAVAAAPVDVPPVDIEVFWGDGCPFCEDLFDFLDELGERIEGFEVREYEVWYDRANQRLFRERAAAHGRTGDAVPLTIVDDAVAWVGFSPQIGRQIEAAVVARLPATDGSPAPAPPPSTDRTAIELPLVGEVTVEGRSLVLSTALIAFVDGFNPCSLWVLTVLLALVLHTGSRRRVLAIGGAFLLVTTLVYGLFLVGVYSALSFVGALGWIRGVVAVFALTFGAINVKDYLWFKAGPSLTIPDERKPGIYRRARALIRPGVSLPAAMAGAAVLAAGVALVEIPCTAGFPVIWSDLVAASGASTGTFGGLLALYLTIYLLDELVIFGAAVVTMRATKLQERHGRALKLVGGTVMMAIGVTIVAAPDLMNEIPGVLAVFGAAVAASGVVAGIDRLVRGRRPPPGQSLGGQPRATTTRSTASRRPSSVSTGRST